MNSKDNTGQCPSKGFLALSALWAKYGVVLICTFFTLLIIGNGFVFLGNNRAVWQFMRSTLVSAGLGEYRPPEFVEWSAAALLTGAFFFVVYYFFHVILNRKKMGDRKGPSHPIIRTISAFLAAIVVVMTLQVRQVQAVESGSIGINAGKAPIAKSPAPVVPARAELVQKIKLKSDPSTNSWDMIQNTPLADMTSERRRN